MYEIISFGVREYGVLRGRRYEEEMCIWNRVTSINGDFRFVLFQKAESSFGNT